MAAVALKLDSIGRLPELLMGLEPSVVEQKLLSVAKQRPLFNFQQACCCGPVG